MDYGGDGGGGGGYTPPINQQTAYPGYQHADSHAQQYDPFANMGYNPTQQFQAAIGPIYVASQVAEPIAPYAIQAEAAVGFFGCQKGFLPACPLMWAAAAEGAVYVAAKGGTINDFTNLVAIPGMAGAGAVDLVTMGQGVSGAIRSRIDARNAAIETSSEQISAAGPNVGSPGTITRIYGNKYEQPSTWDLYPAQQEAINLARRGDMDGSFNCINKACDQLGISYRFAYGLRGGINNDSIGGLANFQTRTILLSVEEFQNNGSGTSLSIFLHEYGHFADAFSGTAAAGSIASEARQMYASSLLFQAVGDYANHQIFYNYAIRLSEGSYP